MHGNRFAAGAAAEPATDFSGDFSGDFSADFPAPGRASPGGHAPSGAPSGTRPGTPPGTPPDPCADIRVLRLADRDATLRRATGSDDPRVHGWLVNDLSFALNTPPALEAAGRDGPGGGGNARADRVCAAVAAMCDIGPRDTLEGMLAAQMVAVHSAALDSLRRAAEPVAADRARDADLRHAARLLNVFQRQMRVRDDRRNPGLARSLTGRHAPDAAGRPPAARVAPEEAGAGNAPVETGAASMAGS